MSRVHEVPVRDTHVHSRGKACDALRCGTTMPGQVRDTGAAVRQVTPEARIWALPLYDADQFDVNLVVSGSGE